MKFLIIGSGFIFPVHTEAIRTVGGKISEVVNTRLGNDYWKEAIKHTDADCVVVLTPNDLHYEIIKTADEAGKIVLCEKPLCLNSDEAEDLATKENIFTVLQLRHHPKVKELKATIRQDIRYNIEMDISVHRDPEYYNSWKGQVDRSGGILFNLGIHYFDLIQYLFGEPTELLTSYVNDKSGSGIIKGKNYECNFILSTDEPKETQRRVFKINGEDINFSSQDNLSYENLHRFVYQDLVKGVGITPKEVLPSIKLIERLKG